jgi:crotonobetainyl-CoA:carnitine CoA-transferase CaiB-like acyl-CoA transferase
MKQKREGLLEGILVLDLADDRGSFCSKLLADLGATVIKVESPEGDLFRTAASFYYHNTNKMGIVLNLRQDEGRDAFRRLIQRADVLVENFRPGYLDALELGYRQLRRINPRIIHLSITGFGQTGPKRNYRACDCVHAAFGGQMHVTGLPSGKPRKLFGPQSFYAASLFGANAVLLNLRRRKSTGKGCHIDLSIQEAVASTLGPVMVDYFHDGIVTGRQGDGYQREPFSMLRCRDGYLQIPILRNWETICELMASEGMAGDLLEKKWQNRSYRQKHYRHIADAVEIWTVNHKKNELFELGQAMGFPWSPVESPEEVLKSPQLKARRFFTRTTIPGFRHKVCIPGLPYRFRTASPFAPVPAPRLGEHTHQVLKSLSAGAEKYPSTHEDEDASDYSSKSGETLRGIRVLDLTRMISGPYATRILGDFGAEVIKIQSRLTASGAELNDTPGFCAWNRNKRSIRLNLNRPEAREILMELVSISDVVVENYSPRVLANWGLSYDRLKAVKPDLVMASISAMGQKGPWKNFVGFAPTFHALSGLIAATSPSLDRPAGIGYAYGDTIAGLYTALAILASIEFRNRSGSGQYIDLSAYEGLCTLLGPAFIDASMPSGSVASDPEAGLHPFDNCCGAAPCGCYPCKGSDRWCVIAISKEAEWQAFCKISNRPELKFGRFSTLSQRKKNREELNTLIGQWTAGYRAETIVRRLQKAGIAAGVVQNADDLAGDSQLAARRFFMYLQNPVLGKSYSDRSALWPWDEKPEHWKAAPSLGEDDHRVFVELLGHSELEFRALVKKGIIA